MPIELEESDVRATLSGSAVYTDDGVRVEVDIGGGGRTVELRPIYSFERDLVDEIIDLTLDGEVAGNAIPVKGKWIHGWLEEKGEDYINSIWKGYQLFLKYVEAETSKIENISTFSKPPGTYDTMYRYLLVLEDLELVERFRRESVDEDAYDFNVPEEFRTRTYVRATASYEGNESKWHNPVNVLYGGGSVEITGGTPSAESEPSQDDIPDEPPETELVDVEDDDSTTAADFIVDDTDGEVDSSDTTSTATDFTVDDTSDGEPTEGVDSASDISVSKPYDLPDNNVNITEFEDINLIPAFVQTYFDEAVEEAFEEAAIIGADVEPSDIELGRIAVTGPWANNQGTPGETPLTIFIGIENNSQGMNPGFLTGSVNVALSDKLTQNNIFGEDVFPSFNVDSSYSNSFRSQLRRHVNRESTGSQYYDYYNNEIKEV